MINTRPVLLTALLFFLLPSLQAQGSTADSVVHRAFASLRTNDEKAFLALYPDAKQFIRFTRSIMEQVLKSDAMKQIFAMDEKTKNMNMDSLIMAEVEKISRPEEYKAMQDKFVSTFRSTLQKGEGKGVQWNEAKLTRYTIDSSTVTDKEAEQFNLAGLKEAKGVIHFSVGDSAYQLAFNKMMFIPDEGGWFGIDFAQLAREGESLEPDHGMFESDTIVTGTDSTAVAAPSKERAKTKQPAVRAGQKTKSPARKPKTKG
jgi:hypothetical protein